MLQQKKKQLCFNVVLIYMDNKVKLKEGKRRDGSNKFGISLVCTAFAYRKRGELLDGKLSFSMTRENEGWNGKNGGFFCRGTSKKRFSAVLNVRFS